MSEPDRMSQLVRFGEFEIDRQACELRRNGQRIPLQIQPFRVLEVLVDHAGEVVSRATLHTTIWPGKVFVDFDHGLNNAVNKLRQALGDSGESPRYIETLPRIGYRFVCQLDAPAATATAPAAKDALPEATTNFRRNSAKLVALSILGLTVLGVATLLWLRPGAGALIPAAAQTSLNAEARDLYQRSLKLGEQRSKESLKLRIEYLQRATELDPTFAPAFAQLALAYAAAGGPGHTQYLNATEALEPALAAARQALRLDPELGEAHIALARVLHGLQPANPANALAIEQSYQRGLELDPANADAHLQFGNFLAKQGREKEALSQFRKARTLDPLSPNINSRLGQELMAEGAIDEGMELLRKTVELYPFQFNARMRLGWGYMTVGDVDAAEREFASADRISPGSVQTQTSLAYIATLRGDTDRARELLTTSLPLARQLDDPLSIALVYVGLKERENALEWLTHAVRQSRSLHRRAPWGLQAPMYDWLRDDPRFRQLEREIEATRGVESGI